RLSRQDGDARPRPAGAPARRAHRSAHEADVRRDDQSSVPVAGAVSLRAVAARLLRPSSVADARAGRRAAVTCYRLSVIGREPTTESREQSALPRSLPSGFGKLARDPAIEGRVVTLALLLERHRRRLERKQDVAEVELCNRADGIRVGGRHLRLYSGIAGISPVMRSGCSSMSSTCTTIAVMLSSP